MPHMETLVRNPMFPAVKFKLTLSCARTLHLFIYTLDLWFSLFDLSTKSDVPLDLRQAEEFDIIGKRYTFPAWMPKSRLQFYKLKAQVVNSWKSRQWNQDRI
jgi:hypothetical protein